MRPDSRHRSTRLRQHRRRGATYVAVLGCTLIVMTMGLAGLVTVRSQARASNSLNDAVDARLNALAGIEFVRARIAGNTGWRTTYSNGSWASGQVVGAGTFSVTVVNPNGTLNRSPYDPVTVTSTGTKNAATHISQVTLVPQPVPYTCLNAAATVNSSVTLVTTTVNGFNEILASNSSVTAVNLTPIYPNVEAVTSIVGLGFQGTTTTGVTARTMPDSTAFDYYTANGTAIGISSLGSPAKLQNVVLSPASNPYGSTTNSQGIYVIDCQGQAITVSQCRVVGTLVLLNAGTTSVQGSVNFAPAVSNYPCLMIQGSATIQFDNTTTLKESTSPATNFNPSGASPPATATPYPWGSSFYNLTTTDTYPSTMAGLVYVSGNLTIANSPSINVLVVGGSLSSTLSTLSLAYEQGYFNNPPPGFCTLPMGFTSGSWQQVVQ